MLEMASFLKKFAETGLNRVEIVPIEVICGPTSDYGIEKGWHVFHTADMSKSEKGK